MEAAAYYVASEALTNAAKYSGATQVVVSARLADDRLEVEVADDGVGGAVVRVGSGLEGLTDRVEALGGSLHFCSRPGQGTSVVAHIPCG